MLTWLLVHALLFIPPHSEPFHFAILGDRTGRAVPNVYEQTWREIEAAKPGFVVTVGDSIEGMDDGRARGEWEALKPIWPRSLKIYQTPGNHDVWDDYSALLFSEKTGHQPPYSFDEGTAHFIILDNSRTDDLDAAQLDFLQRDLERNRGKSPTLIFFHRPFWLIPLNCGRKILRCTSWPSATACAASSAGMGTSISRSQRMVSFIWKSEVPEQAWPPESSTTTDGSISMCMPP